MQFIAHIKQFFPRTALLLCFLLACTSLGCGHHAAHSPHTGKDTPRVFKLNLGTEPPNLDPIRVTDLTSFNVVLNLMRGLVSYSKGQNLQPEMAERWTISPDGKQYTFYLRKATWQDGKPVTAQQFVDGWQRALTKSNGAEYAFFLFPIQNATAFYDGKLSDFSKVGVKALSPQILQVTLSEPIAYFLGLMAAPIAFPARLDLINQFGNRWTEAKHFVGNGPFHLHQWIHDDRMVLTPNTRYFRAPKGIDRIDMLMVQDANTSVVMYENGELDFIETPSSIPAFDARRLKKRPEAKLGNLHAIYYFGFNIHTKPFNNPKVRQAFAYALDRSYYPKILQSGQKPIKSWITPGLVGYNPTLGIKFDPKKARELLAEAGYPNGKGFPEIELAFHSKYDIQKEVEIAQYLWQKHLNVRVRLHNMEWKVFLKKLATDPPPMYRLSWYVDYPDADSFMNLFTSQNGNNYTGLKDPTYDRLIAEAASSNNASERAILYDKAQRLLLEETAAIIPIYQGEKLYLVNPQFKGLLINELNLMFLEALAPN